MAFLPYLQAGMSIFGGLSQMSEQRQQYARLQQFMQQLMGNENAVQNQLLGGVDQLNSEADGYLSPLGGLTSAMNGEATGAAQQAPGAASQYMGDAMSPAALAARSGVDAGAAARGVTDYAGNPNGTNLASTGPGALAFFAKQMMTGIDPMAANNAQDQIRQNFTQGLNTLKSQAGPGANIGAITRDMTNGMLSSSANLAGSLAGESQQLKQQGAQGLVNTAGGMDAQKLQMLMQAFQTAQNRQQTVLGNEAAGAGFGQNVLGQLADFTNIGNQLREYGMGTLGSLDANLTSQGEFWGDLASGAAGNMAGSNPFSIIAQGLSGLPQRNSGGGAPGGASPNMQLGFDPSQFFNMPPAPQPDTSWMTPLSPQSYQPYNMGPMP